MTYMDIYNMKLPYIQKIVPVSNQHHYHHHSKAEFMVFLLFFKSPIFFFLSWRLQALIPVLMIMFGGWIL